MRVRRPGRQASMGETAVRMAAVVAILCMAVLTGAALAAEAEDWPEGTPPFRPEAIIVRPDPADLRTSIWTDKGRYRPGDRVRISFYVSETAYVYIYDLDTTGKVRLIFPNRYEMDNFVRPGTHTIPRRAYSFIVSGPAGAEYLQIIATVRPLHDLAPSSAFTRSPFPELGDDPRAVKGRVEGMLRPAGKGWATAWTAFWIVGPRPPAPPPPPPPPPRPQWGYLRISSDPSGARAYVDGDYVGRTPVEVQVKEGWHTVRLRLEEYPDRQVRVYVEPGERERVEIRWSPHERESRAPARRPEDQRHPPSETAREARPDTSTPQIAARPPGPHRLGLSVGVDGQGTWSLGLEGGSGVWALGGSARFTGPFLPEVSRVDPPIDDAVVVPNGPEWELFVKLAPPLGRLSLEAGIGVAVQPKAARVREAGEAHAALLTYPDWHPEPAEWHLTWTLGTRLDLGRAYLSAAYHNRRGVVAGLGARF